MGFLGFLDGVLFSYVGFRFFEIANQRLDENNKEEYIKRTSIFIFVGTISIASLILPFV